MKLVAKGPITAHGKDGPTEITKGDEFEVANEAKAKWLIDVGAAKASKSTTAEPESVETPTEVA